MGKTIIYQSPNKTVYVENGMTVKLFDNSFPTPNILNEALNQARAEESGLNIPKVREVTKIDGKWAILMDYVEGKNLAQLMEENPQKIEEYLDLMVDLQTEMHEKSVQLLPRLKDKMLYKISQTSFDDGVKYELQMRLESMPKHSKLCHGDFTPGNIMITPQGEVYLIDWSHATQGNAALDVARTYLTFCLENKTEIAERYLDKFCQKTDTKKEYVQRLLPVVAASQSVKDKPEELALLAKWVDVIEYQ